MPYFKYSFLNWLRDEVILTRTWSKVTVLHLLMGMGPAAGIGVGMGYGQSRTWIHSVAGVMVGGMLGILITWPLPKVLFQALEWLVRKGWFVRYRPEESPPVAEVLIGRDEFEARVKEYDARVSRANRALLLSIIPFGVLLALSWVFREAIERDGLVQGICGGMFVAYVAGGLFWEWRRGKRAAREAGIVCLNCGHMVTDGAGMVAVPWGGRCKECGLKMIAVGEEE